MSFKNPTDRWGPVSQLLHWTIAALIVAVAVIGLWMDTLPRSPRTIEIYALHKSIGLSILALVVLRLAWRGYAGAPRTLPGMPAWQHRLATLTHAGLYALLFAVPLYNFGVSQHFKAWVDLVITDPRMGPGTTTLAGKPTELVVVRGGSYRAGTPREGWDHATPWMRRVLADVWGLDLTVTETDFTLVGVNPAMDQFTDMAAEMRAESEAVARQHGTELSRRRAEAAA